MTDAFDCPIETGNTVVWVNRKGSAQWLSWGLVEKHDEGSITVYRKKPSPERYVNLKTGNLIAVVR